MMKRMLLCVGLLLSLSSVCLASRLLTLEQALAAAFPEADEVKPETVTPTPEQVATLKERMGGRLMHYSEGSMVSGMGEVTFHVATQGGKVIGVGVVTEEPGKWGPMEFFVAMNATTGAVQNVAVMAYTETRGRGVARRTFLEQFKGKVATDSLEMWKEINAVTGATVSSECAAFAVKKALVLLSVLRPAAGG